MNQRSLFRHDTLKYHIRKNEYCFALNLASLGNEYSKSHSNAISAAVFVVGFNYSNELLKFFENSYPIGHAFTHVYSPDRVRLKTLQFKACR